MTSAYRKKKQPELIRQTLLENAIQLALTEGLGAVTVQAVAAKTGVTKGGFFHHFPTREALDDAVFEYLLEEFTRTITELMDGDEEPHGQFTRAYIAAAFQEDDSKAALWLSALNNARLKEVWTDWYEGLLAERQAHESGPQLATARLAADGIWLTRIQGLEIADQDSLRDYLVSLTRPASA